MTQKCVPYKETLMHEFERIGFMFDPDNERRTIDVVSSFPQDIALKMYGTSQQARYGDNNTPKPPGYDIVAVLKWEAWDKERGQPTDKMIRIFLDYAYGKLKEKGIPPAVDYDKKVADKEYIKCLEKYGDVEEAARQKALQEEEER